MSPQAWAILGCAVVALALILVGLAGLGREGQRLQKRVNAMLERPAAIDLTAASNDLVRLSLSIDRLTELSARAALAIARIRAQVGLLNRLVRGFPGPT